MSLQNAKLVYQIQNGPLKGQRQVITIPVESEKLDVTSDALDGVVTAASISGNLIALILYMTQVRGSARAFQEIQSRLRILEAGAPRPLAEGEIEVGADGADAVVGAAEDAAAEAEIVIVEEGALDAAAASGLCPGVGWVISATLLTVVAVVDVGLLSRAVKEHYGSAAM